MVSKDGDHNLSGVSLHFETPDHGTLFIQNVAVKFSSARNKSKADRVVPDIVTSKSYDQSQFLQLFVQYQRKFQSIEATRAKLKTEGNIFVSRWTFKPSVSKLINYSTLAGGFESQTAISDHFFV